MALIYSCMLTTPRSTSWRVAARICLRGGGRGGAELLDGGLVAGGDGGWREGGDEGERSEGWWQVAGARLMGGEKALLFCDYMCSM